MSRIRIGWATRDVTTDQPIPITGQAHLRISQGVLDPVTTTALALDDGNDCVIFVSMDTTIISCGLLDEVRAQTQALCPELPVEKIIIGATHSHTVPCHYTDTYSLHASADPIDHAPVRVEMASCDGYRRWLTAAMAEMIAEAWNGRKEGGVAYGYGYAVVAHSRRVCYFDDLSLREPRRSKADTFAVNGTAAMYGNTNDDNFSHYEAGADHFINLLYTFDESGQLTGAIVNVPCPAQNSEQEWMLSADYWHDVRVALRQRYGDGLFILPQCAAAGDLSPRILHYKKAQERRFRLKYGMTEGGPSQVELCARRDIAGRIAEAFSEVLSWAQKDVRTELPIAHQVSTVHLSRRMASEEEYELSREGLRESQAQPFADTDDPMADLIHNTKVIRDRKRFYDILSRHAERETVPTLPMELHVLRIGDIAFATNRFELYMDFQHRMQARSPFEQTFIVQLCAQPGLDGGTYLCTERADRGRGYSAIPFSCLISPAGGQQLVEETVKQLKALHP